MPKAVCSVSPIIYLHRIGALDWLPKLFDKVLMPSVVLEDLLEGRFIGYNVPSPFDLPWIEYEDAQLTIPSAWISLDLSSGEVAAMSVAFENPSTVVLLDDPMARKAAKAVGIPYWGTLKIMLEAKKRGLIDRIAPYVDRLGNTGIWIPDETRQRILKLGAEDIPPEPEPAPPPPPADVIPTVSVSPPDETPPAETPPPQPAPPKN